MRKRRWQEDMRGICRVEKLGELLLRNASLQVFLHVAPPQLQIAKPLPPLVVNADDIAIATLRRTKVEPTLKEWWSSMP